MTTLVCAALVLSAGVDHLAVGLLGGQRDDPGFWHVSLVSLLFWIGLTQGMVALSALLRLTHASWRYPLNRLLDMASLFGLWGPLLLPLLVAGAAPDLWAGRRRITATTSGACPARWSGTTLAVGTAYLAGWMLLYLTSLPDFAVLRDRAAEGSKEKTVLSRVSPGSGAGRNTSGACCGGRRACWWSAS